MDVLVRISRGPNICPSVCASRPLLACACVTLARWVRRYCRVSWWCRGTVVALSITRLTSLSWPSPRAPSGNGVRMVQICTVITQTPSRRYHNVRVWKPVPVNGSRVKVKITVCFVRRTRWSISGIFQWLHPLLTGRYFPNADMQVTSICYVKSCLYDFYLNYNSRRTGRCLSMLRACCLSSLLHLNLPLSPNNKKKKTLIPHSSANNISRFYKAIKVWKPKYSCRWCWGFSVSFLYIEANPLLWSYLLPDSGPAPSDWLHSEVGGRYRQEWGVTGGPSSTAGHTQTGNPRLSDQGRSLEPEKFFTESFKKKKKMCKGTHFEKAALPTRNLEPDPNSPADRLCNGTSEAEGSVVLYKALDSRPERQKQHLDTDTLVYQLIINITTELNPFGTTALSLKGCERTIPLFWDWVLTFAAWTSQKEKYCQNNTQSAALWCPKYLLHRQYWKAKSRHTFQIPYWIITAIRNIKSKTGASHYLKQTPLALLVRFMPG